MYVRNVTALCFLPLLALLVLGMAAKRDTELEALEPIQDCPVAPSPLPVRRTDQPYRRGPACNLSYELTLRAEDATSALGELPTRLHSSPDGPAHCAGEGCDYSR
jgi:hypothetical protein